MKYVCKNCYEELKKYKKCACCGKYILDAVEVDDEVLDVYNKDKASKETKVKEEKAEHKITNETKNVRLIKSDTDINVLISEIFSEYQSKYPDELDPIKFKEFIHRYIMERYNDERILRSVMVKLFGSK